MSYMSDYTGAEIDAAIGAVQSAVAANGIVNVNGLNTILGDYLTSSTAANTYLTSANAANTYAPLTGTGTSGTWPINISGNSATTNQLTAYGLLGPQVKLPQSETTFAFLTNGNGASYANFGRIGLADSYASINLTNYRFHCNGGHARFDGTVNIYPGATSGWTEGLRIHSSTAGWTTLILCGTDNTGDSGTSANSWSMHTLSGNFYLTKNNSTGGPVAFQCIDNHFQFCNLGTGYNYDNSALWIREYNYGGAQSDTWGVAPRLGWHWSGRVAAQIGLGSNGYLYEAPVTNTNFYQIQINTGSSRTIKHDISPLPDMGDKIDLLQPVSFIYNDHPDEGIRYGLIHEDTVDIMPDICKFDENQNGGRTVNYTDLIPVLIKEIQSLRKRLKSLEDKNN